MPVGRPTLVHMTAVKGSAIAPKSRWAVPVGVYREQVIFWSPYTKREFRSKSFTSFKLRSGMNFMHFLGLPVTDGSQGTDAVPEAMNQNVTIMLPDMKEMSNIEAMNLKPDVVHSMKHTVDDNAAEPAIIHNDESLNEADDTVVGEGQPLDDSSVGAPEVSQHNSSSELGGSVRIVDPEGQDYDLDIDTGELLNSNIIDENSCFENAESLAEHYDRDDGPSVKLSNDAEMQK